MAEWIARPGSADLPALCSCKPSETAEIQQRDWVSKNGWKSMGLLENLFIPSCPCWALVAEAFWKPMKDWWTDVKLDMVAKTGYGILWNEEIEYESQW